MDSNIAELYIVNTEQCLGIDTYFTIIGKTWCSARSLSLITTHASNLSLNLLLKKSTISFSVTQAPVMIIRGVISLRDSNRIWPLGVFYRVIFISDGLDQCWR